MITRVQGLGPGALGLAQALAEQRRQFTAQGPVGHAKPLILAGHKVVPPGCGVASYGGTVWP